MSMCQACEDGRHWECTLASWCECEDESDGCDPSEIGYTEAMIDEALDAPVRPGGAEAMSQKPMPIEQVKAVLEELTRLVDEPEYGLRSGGAVIPAEHLHTWEKSIIEARDALASALEQLDAVERERGWMRSLLLRSDSTWWMSQVEGPRYFTGDMDELAFFRSLRAERFSHLAPDEDAMGLSDGENALPPEESTR